MQFIANKVNDVYLRNILPPENANVESVFAAIAYGSIGADEKNDLIGNCLKLNCRLDIWMRYDHTVPVSVPLLNRLLKEFRNNIFCRLIPDVLHAKVIWWKGYGAYIGSANLTDRAWLTNIEAGFFLNEVDLQTTGVIADLEGFFEYLQDLDGDKSAPLTKEIIDEMIKFQKIKGEAEQVSKLKRTIPIWHSPSRVDKQKSQDLRKEIFRKEWHETLTTLRHIGSELSKARPKWISPDVPLEWQTDQFLHAFYYNKVADGLKKPYEDFYQLNKHNPQNALEHAIDWWKNTNTPPSNEDHTFNIAAPYIRANLSSQKVLNITNDEFAQICQYTHATKDHVIKISLSILGRPDLVSLSRDERMPLFASWLMSHRNQEGWDVKRLLHYVLYEGRDESLWERLYEAARSEKYRLAHYGLNSLAEIVGWSRPEIAPPRNGRTSKALRALGYDVRIY